MPTLHTERLGLTCQDDPRFIDQILNRATGRVVCDGGEQRLLVRLPGKPSDPIFLRDVTGVDVTETAVRCTLADETGAFRAAFAMTAGPHGLHFEVEVAGPEPMWMVEWMLEGLHLDEVIVPALGGQTLTRAMPAETQVTYKYPFWWNAQFAVGATDAAGGVWLRTMRAEPHFQLLRVHRVEEQPNLFGLGLGFEADAPITACTLTAEWYLDGYTGSWEQPAEVHRQWMEQAFSLVPYREHPHFPAWADDVNMILEMWGMRKDQGRPAHTFDDMVERIEAFAALHPPEQTLVYLPGFAEQGIDSNAPDYNPSPMLGGREGLRRLVDRAHALGYRVMVHTNVLAMTYTHPRFPDFEAHQVVDPFGRPQGWGNDMDGDWLHEPYFAYINPGAPAWSELMTTVLGDLIASFDLDGVFLDQTLLAFNTSRGPNFLAGMRRHIEHLQQAYPQVLFAGEGLHELVLPALPMVQIHGLDSITGVHGLEGGGEWRRVHPVSTYVFSPYTKFTAHLLTRHPSSSTFLRQEAAYAQLGIVPALVCYRRSQALDSGELRKMLYRARQLGQRTEAPTP